MMNGPAHPPGLRFPTGAIIGKHLIIAGTYLTQSQQSFSLWTLDLNEMTWSRIDPGTFLTTGSWSRGELWAEASIYVVFGNRTGSLVEDYNRRLLNWHHAVYIELEAFGIYTYPTIHSPIEGQLLGLDALEAELFADFEILCEDGRKIKCSRKLLEERWPWFKRQRARYIEAARDLVARQIPSEFEIPLPDPLSEGTHHKPEDRPDPRLTPRMLLLSEPYPITKALLQYFYSGSLITPLQHAPLVLNALLLLSAIYELPHLSTLIKHIMHQALSPATSVGVYQVATLCDSQNLQIRLVFHFPSSISLRWLCVIADLCIYRALNLVMGSSRKGARQPSHTSPLDQSDPAKLGDSYALTNRNKQTRGVSDANVYNDVHTTASQSGKVGHHPGVGSDVPEHLGDLGIRRNPRNLNLDTALLKVEVPVPHRGSDSDTRGLSPLHADAVPLLPSSDARVFQADPIPPSRVGSSNQN